MLRGLAASELGRKPSVLEGAAGGSTASSQPREPSLCGAAGRPGWQALVEGQEKLPWGGWGPTFQVNVSWGPLCSRRGRLA